MAALIKQDILKALKNPYVTTGLLGTGIGAGLGGAYALGSPERRKHLMKYILTMGLLGGGLGAAGRYLYDLPGRPVVKPGQGAPLKQGVDVVPTPQNTNLMVGESTPYEG